MTAIQSARILPGPPRRDGRGRRARRAGRRAVPGELKAPESLKSRSILSQVQVEFRCGARSVLGGCSRGRSLSQWRAGTQSAQALHRLAVINVSTTCLLRGLNLGFQSGRSLQSALGRGCQGLAEWTVWVSCLLWTRDHGIFRKLVKGIQSSEKKFPALGSQTTRRSRFLAASILEMMSQYQPIVLLKDPVPIMISEAVYRPGRIR